jgi:tetratricopeptide (TPR) repeat protein
VSCFQTVKAEDTKADSLITAIATMADDTSKVWAYAKLSEIYETFDVREAMDLLDKMEALSLSLKYPKGIWNAQFLKGRLAYTIQKPDSALGYYMPLLDNTFYKTTALNKARLNANIGIAYQLKGDHKTALEYLNSSLEMFNELKSHKGICATLNNLAISHYSLDNIDLSLRYFQDSYNYMVKNDYTLYLPNVISNITAISIAQGKPNMDSTFLEILERDEVKNNLIMKSTIYHNLGVAYTNYDKLIKAEYYLREAEKLFSKIDVKNNEDLFFALAILYEKKGDYSQSLTYFNKVLNNPVPYAKLNDLYKNIAQLYGKLNLPDSAYKYWNMVVEHNESTSKREIKDLLVKAESNLSLFKKDSEIDELHVETKLLNAKKLRNRLIIGFLSLVLVITGIAVWFYVNREKERKRIREMRLQAQNQKLIELSKQIGAKNEIIENIESTLSQHKELVNIKDELSTSLKESFHIEKDWETFGLYFEDQHQGFYQNLKKEFPELTNNDLRICSLAKMRMSTKEAANTLNLSLDAIKSSRYRIRKKLQLEQEIDLSDFLSEI